MKKVCLILMLLSCVPSFAAEKIALLLDQPAGRVPDLQAGWAVEVGERLFPEIQKLYPTDDGRIVDFSGNDVSLEDFQKIWVHAGDTMRREGALFSDGAAQKLREFLQAGNRTLFFMGGTAGLVETLGLGTVTTQALPMSDDRHQSGLVPADEGIFLWKGLTSDREVFWFTNAVYPAYQKCEIMSEDAVKVATVPAGPDNPLVFLPVGTSGVWVWNVRFSPMYDRASAGFQTNTETFLKNLLCGTVNDADRERLLHPIPPVRKLPTAALRRAVEDLIATYGSQYPLGPEFLKRLEPFESGENNDPEAFAALRKEALLANPGLDFDKILFLRRNGSKLGFPVNHGSNSELPKAGYQNTICQYDLKTGQVETLFTPPNDFFVGDMELHFDADRVLFSMPAPDVEGNRFRLWEYVFDTRECRKIPTIEDSDVENYDACYLPDDSLVFCSTACFTGVPCVNGSGHVCNLYRKNAADGKITQLTLEQDHDWCPTLLPNGRVMYLRWEYSDLPHAFSRILFHMNPDGTNQTEYYGSGSYFPNAMFYARPVPGTKSRFVAIFTGHHDLPRVGDLVLYDPSLGRRETEGAVQRIPGWGKPVERVVLDYPIAQTVPLFVHPYPITDKVFLVSCKTDRSAGWRICLVDLFDNIVPLVQEPGFAMLEPIPLRKTPRPPVLPDRTNRDRTDADVFLADIYYGQGLPGVPRGTVKALRIFTYEFAYQGMGAEPHSVGLDGPWDPKRILGTVPVYEDGSASFTIPANTPVAFQPLDKEGRAIQYMRSWTTAMPGEQVSCTGCHEEQNSAVPPMRIPIASKKPPVPITPFYGAVRGFRFRREIQPILDKYCVDCHEEKNAVSFKDSYPVPAFDHPNGYNQASRFSPSYYHLRRYVRTQTKESQMGVHKPFEFYADSTHLVQLLQQGHYDVQLDRESWDKLNAWIDLNAPFYGSWGESRNYQIAPLVKHQYERRLALRQLYGHTDEQLAENPDDYPPVEKPQQVVYPHKDDNTPRTAPVKVPAVPTSSERVAGLEMIAVPGQKYSMSACEITNAQFAQFDPSHDTGIEYGDYIHFSPGESGWLLSRANQPVARVSWHEAQAYCKWLSEKTGRKFSLPTEEQWRLAAAAGTTTPFWFGDKNVDYALYENLSDISNQRINPFGWLGRTGALPPWRIADSNVDDRSRVSAMVGSYRPNPWGFYDLFGNVAEWTRSEKEGKKIVVGGSWYTPARWSTIDSRRYFQPYHNVFDVGFRVVCEP